MYILNDKTRPTQYSLIFTLLLFESGVISFALSRNSEILFVIGVLMLIPFAIGLVRGARYYDIRVDGGYLYIGNLFKRTLKVPASQYDGLEGFFVYNQGKGMPYGLLKLKNGKQYTFPVDAKFKESWQISVELGRALHAALYPVR